VGTLSAGERRTPSRLDAMARILLDSTILIDALRGRSAAERIRLLRRQGDEPWICAISVEEIWRGILTHEEQVAGRLLRALRMAPLGLAEGERAGRWRRRYADSGVTLHQADCLIAAAAVGVGATLATGNPRHFPMPEVTVEDWPTGV
jgi:predicted nucleic acid-binding protein